MDFLWLAVGVTALTLLALLATTVVLWLDRRNRRRHGR